ncbi:glycosyltransferase [Aestuariirhabdus litorea]|uniref:Glycosyltransferase n=1 Tax=Aestuariirhabdus litorea TaxID=2528527 RepID=A0A3P3VXW5_9GAMM|nr:glycosyltransferase [Aestuariirhabdus litorea]RWW98733.1 glycosyltransferase [Endozoicomonadaceae bacterium GTF-13]
MISLIVPCFNEQHNLDALYRRLIEVMSAQPLAFELILVNDGSTDQTLQAIQALSRQDKRVRYASFSRNFGHEAASSCGFELARGDAAILLDADLQDPPELIPQMIERWQQGAQVVYGKRTSRSGESLGKRATSYLFYRLLNRLSSTPIPADVGDFRLVDRVVIDHFNALPERNRFVRGMFSWVGFRQEAIPFTREARHQGETKYNWLKLFVLAFDAVTAFSVSPLRLCSLVGLLVTLASFSAAIVVSLQKIFWGMPIPGYAFATAGMFLLGGVQLLFLGMIGEYIGKIYTQVQGRPLYIISETEPSKESTGEPQGAGD